MCSSVFISFLPDLRNGLLDWDDAGYILENTNIHSLSFETVSWAFSSFHLNYWAPLTWLSLAVDYFIWGGTPLGYHLTNNILHALNAGMFFLVCLELLSVRPVALRQGDIPFLPNSFHLSCAMLAALFFAVHPLRVESVAWATERKDVLSLFFGLPAILFYLRHIRATSSRTTGSHRNATGRISLDYWFSLAFFSLSLMSKSLMITLPVVLLILDWYPLKRMKSTVMARVLLEKVPYFFLAGAASLLTMSAQAQVIEPINLYTRLLNAFSSITAYLRLTVWPFDLSPFYVHPYNIAGMSFEYALPIALFTGITICCALLMKRRPLFMAVWLIYLVTLLPFLGLTQQVGAQAMAGRFTYFAGLPLALLFSLGVNTAFARFAASRTACIALGAGVAVLLLVNGYLTVREISFWKDDVTLWTRVIELSPNTGRAYFQRSHAYRLKRDYQKSLSDIEQAITIAASKQYRAMHELYLKRAAIRLDMGEFDRAVADYTKALETVTADKRAMILYERGLAYQKSGRDDLANEDFRLAGMTERIR